VIAYDSATGGGTVNANVRVVSDGNGQRIQVANQNASHPPYSFINDPNTGFFRTSNADTMSLSLGGTEQFRWVENGTDGDFHATGDIIAFSTTPSDLKLKTNIEDINKGLEDVMKLRPVSYDWKHRFENSFDYGLIAQEVEEILPSLVSEKELMFGEKDEKYKTIRYERLIPILIKSIQELNEEINKLKNKG